jgi:hypothetical protein
MEKVNFLNRGNPVEAGMGHVAENRIRAYGELGDFSEISLENLSEHIHRIKKDIEEIRYCTKEGTSYVLSRIQTRLHRILTVVENTPPSSHGEILNDLDTVRKAMMVLRLRREDTSSLEAWEKILEQRGKLIRTLAEALSVTTTLQ